MHTSDEKPAHVQEPIFSDDTDRPITAAAAAVARVNSSKAGTREEPFSDNGDHVVDDDNNDGNDADNRQVGFASTVGSGGPHNKLTKIKADPWRFAVAPIFVVLSITNAMQWIAFSPIVNEVCDFFNMTPFQVNFLATTYVIAYVAIVFLSCKLYEVTGIKNGVMVAAAANALGSLIKIIALYAWPHSALLFVAQVFNSFTEVLTIATPPLIANRWFPENERMVANTIMSSALNFGCGIGVLFPTFFVGPDKDEKRHFGHFFWFHFALCFFVLVMVVFLFPKKPKHAASFAGDRQQTKEDERMRKARKTFQIGHNSSNSNSSHDATTTDGEGADEMMMTRGRGNMASNSPANHNTNDDINGAEFDFTTVTKSGEATGAVAGGSKKSKKKKAADKKTTSSNAPEEELTPGSPANADDNDNDTDSNAATTTTDEDIEVEPINVFSVLLDCLREARRNYSFVLLTVAAAAQLGLIWSMATVLPQVLEPYGISESISGWIGFLNLVLGTVICPCMMPLVEKYGRRYKLILCTLGVVLTCNMVLLTLLLNFGPKNADGSVGHDNSYYVIVTFVLWGGVSGLCQNFMMPLMFEYVVELTFPMSESTSAPTLTWAACLSNFVLTLIFGAVLTEPVTAQKSLRVFIGATVVTAVGAAAFFFTKPMYRRRDYERLRQEDEDRMARENAETEGNDFQNSSCGNYENEEEDVASHHSRMAISDRDSNTSAAAAADAAFHKSK